MKEDFLQFAWKFRLFSTPNLQTTDGEPVSIIRPGIHNSNAGPDFLEAQLRVGEKVWIGHVEIHVNASDWHRHGHGTDPAYDNVVLHAVFNPDKRINLAHGGEMPVMDLSQFIDLSYRERYSELMENLREVPCADKLHRVRNITREMWLDRLSIERLERKTSDIQSLVTNNRGDWRETSYQLLARNFGFKVNAHGMVFLAESLPYSLLSHHLDSRFQIEALLFGQSGLLHKDHEDEYARELWLEYKYLKRKFRLSAINPAAWKRLRLMPANFPEVRISQFAHYLHLHQDFFTSLTQIHNVSHAVSDFKVEASQYWQNHSAFDRVCKQRKVALGKGSVENIVINTITPVLFAYGRHKVKQQLVDIALRLIEELKSENNKIVRSWRANGLALKSARDSQACLELYNEYCAHKKCLNCMIGAELISDK